MEVTIATPVMAATGVTEAMAVLLRTMDTIAPIIKERIIWDTVTTTKGLDTATFTAVASHPVWSPVIEATLDNLVMFSFI